MLPPSSMPSQSSSSSPRSATCGSSSVEIACASAATKSPPSVIFPARISASTFASAARRWRLTDVTRAPSTHTRIDTSPSESCIRSAAVPRRLISTASSTSSQRGRVSLATSALAASGGT